MSDSSSGESSDDDILNMPVFKKRDRRTERASKSKLSFLDACLDGTNQRTDAQRRLANVESEHMLETEKQEDNVEEMEEEMTPQAADKAKGTEVTQHEADNDSNCSEKRKKVVTMAATKAERAPSMHHNEDVYWDRVESFNSTNKTKMNAGIDADRGKLSDAMNGLDYNSETDDEDGKWNDGNGGMTREQLRSEARAKLQGLSAAVGTRRMFQQTTSTTTSKACVYDSKLEATNELKLIVSTLQMRYHNEADESKQILRCQLLDPLNKVFKKPKELLWGMLLRFLQQNVLVNGTCDERVILPKPICIWMWNAACSSFEVMGHVSTACRQNLVKMLVNEMDIDDGTFSADLSFIEKLSINDFISSLENECGLWLNAGPAPINDGRNNDDNTASRLDVYALKNRFLLWKAAFERDLINLDVNDGDSKLFQEATNAVTALTRIGIDPNFSLANENINFCISTLPSIVQSLSAALVNSTIRQISKLQSQPDDAKKWIERTADSMVEACSNLKAGDEGTADQDDEDGWLPLACAAERMIDFEDEELSFDVIEMKLNFITLALSRCLKEDSVGDRENQLKEATTRFKDLVIEDDSNDTTKQRLLQTAMHALVNAAINLRCVEKRAGSFQNSKDHPLYLAAILLSGECAFVGLHLSKQILKNNLQLQTEEKDALVESMSIIETTCNNMKKKCVSVIAYPHLRRIKEYLTRLGKALTAMKGKSTTDKRRKTRTQGSLDGWRRSSLPPSEDTQDKSLFEFSQDSNCSSIFLESQD